MSHADPEAQRPAHTARNSPAAPGLRRSSATGTLTLITGPVGSGKTHYLRSLPSLNDQRTRVVGVELDSFLAPIAFAGWDRLLDSIAAITPIAEADQNTDSLLSSVRRALVALDEASATAALTIYIDGVQWLDESSAQAVILLLDKLAGSAVEIILNSRDDESPQLQAFRDLLGRVPGAQEIALDGLEPQEIIVIAAERGLMLTPAVASRLRERTGGNPLHVVTVVERMRRDGLSQLPEPLPTPALISRDLERRIGDLEPAVRTVVELLSLSALPLPIAAFRDLALGLGEPLDLPAAREWGVATSPIGARTAPRVSVPHGTVRQAARGLLSRDRERELHAALATVTTGSIRAHHLVSAAPGHDAAIAEEIVDLAELADHQGALEESGRLFILAAQVHPDRARRDELTLESAWRGIQRENYGALAAMDEEIQACAPSIKKDLVNLALASMHVNVEAGMRLIARLESEGALVDPRNRLSLFACKAGVYFAGGKFAEMMALFAQADADTELDRTDTNWFWMLNMRGYALWLMGDYPAAITHLSTVIEGADSVADQARARTIRAGIHFFSGNPDAAFSDAVTARRDALRWGDESSALRALANQALTEFSMGLWDDARAHALQASDLSVDLGDPRYLSVSYAVLAMVAAETGSSAEAESYVELMRTEPMRDALHLSLGLGEIAEATVHLRAGRSRQVIAVLSPFAQSERPSVAPAGEFWWRTLYVSALVEMGRVDEAAAQGPLISAIGHNLPVFQGVAHLIEGVIARASGDEEKARSALTSAITGPMGQKSAYLVDQAREEMSHLSDAVPAAPQSEHEELLARLTERERVMAVAAVRGLSNAEIATAHFITQKTVEYHLSNAYAKLAVHSRRELRALWGTAI